MTHDRILVATDGSEPSREAAAEAVALADALGATLHALYVLETAEPPPWYEDPAAEPGVDTRAGTALEVVTDEAAERGLGSDVVTAVAEGETAPAILQYARDHDVDLVVVGTQGRSGIDRLVLGSVAEHVVRESPVPVVTTRPDESR